MHSHPHGLTHPDKRGCVVYSRQLCRTAKNLGVLCCPAREVSHCRFLSGFPPPPTPACFTIRLCSGIPPRTRAAESLHRSAVLLQMLSPLFLFCLFALMKSLRHSGLVCRFEKVAHAQSLRWAAGRITTILCLRSWRHVSLR